MNLVNYDTFYHIRLNSDERHIITSLITIKGSHVDQKLNRADAYILNKILEESGNQASEEVLSQEKNW